VSQTKAQLLDGSVVSVAFSAGSAATPSVYYSADATTGVYFPGTGQVSIATGGTQRVTVDASGRVGIGTTSPQTKLSISNSGAEGVEFIPGSAGNVNITQHYNRSGATWVENRNDASYHSWYIQGTERARIDSSGRLLVGTSTSASIATREASIQIASTALAPNVLSGLSTSADVFGPNIALAKSRGGASPAVISDDTLGTIIFAGHDGTDLTTAGAYIFAQVDGAVSNDDLPTRLVFSTTADGAASPTERMRIGSDGTIRLINALTNLNWGPVGGNRWGISPNNDDFYIANNNFTKYAVLVTQNFTGWTFASDSRIKENIQDLEYGINQLKALKPRRFNFIGQDSSTIGFIAQEVQAVVPEAVTGEEIPYKETDTSQEKASKTLGITKDALIPLLTKALQEAIAKIETLEARLTAAGIE